VAEQEGFLILNVLEQEAARREGPGTTHELQPGFVYAAAHDAYAAEAEAEGTLRYTEERAEGPSSQAPYPTGNRYGAAQAPRGGAAGVVDVSQEVLVHPQSMDTVEARAYEDLQARAYKAEQMRYAAQPALAREEDSLGSAAALEGSEPEPEVSTAALERSLRSFYQTMSPDKLYKVPKIVGKFTSSGATVDLLRRLNAGSKPVSISPPSGTGGHWCGGDAGWAADP